MKEKHYQPGETIVLREIWEGRIWTARPMLVVQDTPELLALTIPTGTLWKRYQSPSGNKVTGIERKNGDWRLTDALWDGTYEYLRLTIPGENYSVIVFWHRNFNEMRHWYINLEVPLYRTPLGFDYVDQILDVIVRSDLQVWHWEDEDELKEAIELGLVSEEQANALYAKGAEVRDLIISGKSIFNGWEKWRPDPNWKVPVLPAGWDII